MTLVYYSFNNYSLWHGPQRAAEGPNSFQVFKALAAFVVPEDRACQPPSTLI